MKELGFHKTLRNGFFLNFILLNSAVKILPLPTLYLYLSVWLNSFFLGGTVSKAEYDLRTSVLLRDRRRGRREGEENAERGGSTRQKAKMDPSLQ